MTKKKKKPMSMSERGRLGAAAVNRALTAKQRSAKMRTAVLARWAKVKAAKRKAGKDLKAADIKACKLFAETQGTTTRKVRRSMRKAAKP